MKQFTEIYKKVGGTQIIFQYFRAHVLLFALMQTIFQGFSKKSLEIVRLSVHNRILLKLRKNYKSYIVKNKLTDGERLQLSHERSDKVWICWLQGIENAPFIVKKCYQSLQENLADREIVLLTDNNWQDYVQLPEYVQKKVDEGIITRTHLSDLIRLELLIKYGGTWIDATVFCSGDKVPDYILNSDLFIFQCLKPGLDGHCTFTSSWFITACTNQPIIMLTQKLLYEYWRKNNSMVDYFLFHDFFQLAIETYPEEWKKVIPFCSSVPHILLLRLFESYDEKTWKAAKEMTCFHKLTYKFELNKTEVPNTYYNVLFKTGI